MTDARRRFLRLYEAGLNLGMRPEDAVFYARKILAEEMERGDWHIVPRSAEAIANDCP